MKTKFNYLKNWFLPHICLFCKNYSYRHQDLCIACWQELPLIKNPCIRCAKPLFSDLSLTCGDCLKNSPPFTKTVTLFAYQTPITHLIMQLKFNQKLMHARLLSELVTEKVLQIYPVLPDLIIPMPLHKKRLQERGFNQTVEIAKYLSKKLHIPLDTENCIRTKHTLAQARLSKRARLENIKQAFEVKTDYSNRFIVVIEDVITTGSTVNEFCRQLKKAGAARIDVWCCARA